MEFIKEYRLDKIGDFNDLVDFYLNMMEYAENLKNTNGQEIPVKCIDSFKKMILSKRALYQNMIIDLSKFNLKKGPNSNKKRLVCLCPERNGKIHLRDRHFKVIKESELIELRKILCHGDFDTFVRNPRLFEKGMEVYLRNCKKPHQRITIDDSLELRALFSTFNVYSQDNRERIIPAIPKGKSCFNNDTLNNYLDEVYFVSLSASKTPKNNENNKTKITFIKSEEIDGNSKIMQFNASKKEDELRKISKAIMKECGVNLGIRDSFQDMLLDMTVFAETKGYDVVVKKEQRPELKEQIADYIKYIGFIKWNELNNNNKGRAISLFISRILNHSFNNYGIDFIATDYSDLTRGFLPASDMKTVENVSERYKQSFFGPFIYSDLVLGLSQYCFGYMREVNKHSNKPIFHYRNIGLCGLDTLNGKSPDGFFQYNMLKSKDKITRDIKPSEDIKKNEIDIVNAEARIKNNQNELLKCTSEERKKELEKKIKKDEEIVVLKKQRNVEMKEIQCLYGDDTYKDSSNLFKHIRNSLEHGLYETRYDRALKEKDLRKIEFTFYDQDDTKGGIRNFEMTITAEKLVRLVKNFQNSINEQANEKGKEFIEDQALEIALRDFELNPNIISRVFNNLKSIVHKKEEER